MAVKVWSADNHIYTDIINDMRYVGYPSRTRFFITEPLKHYILLFIIVFICPSVIGIVHLIDTILA